MIIRLPNVKAKAGVSRSFIYAGVKAGTFPAPISLGSKAIGWLESEVDAWIESRVKATRDGSLTRPTSNSSLRCIQVNAKEEK